MKSIVVDFAAPADPLSMNNAPGRVVERITRVAPWRDVAYYRWCELHPGVGPAGRAFGSPADVRVSLPFATHRRRDPINFTPTVKAIVDGLVLAGAWPDDTPDYVTQHVPSLCVIGEGNMAVTRAGRAFGFVVVRVSTRPTEEEHPR